MLLIKPIIYKELFKFGGRDVGLEKDISSLWMLK